MKKLTTLIILALISLPSTFANDLPVLMQAMRTEFTTLNAGATNPTPETSLAANQLRKLALQAAELPPVSDPSQILDYQRILTQVALNGILIQDAFLKKDQTKSTAILNELKALMREGHTKFK